MPHCILEASDNLLDRPDWGALLREIHRTLAGTGLFREEDIKSRMHRPEAFRVADGAPDRAFVALDLQILAGRSDEVKAQVSDALMGVLAGAFPLSAAGMRLNLTVQVSELHASSYRRHTSGQEVGA